MNFRIFDDPIAELVVWGTIGAVCVAVGAYVVSKLRPKPAQQEPESSELLSKFRDLHSEGQLTDAEFRTIKTTLGARLQDELTDNDETG